MSKTRLVLASALILILLAQSLQAVEFMYKDNQGYDLYSCGSNRRGGLVKVKVLGNSQYQILSKQLSGVFELSPATVEGDWCLGTVGAARIACGLCKFASPPETKPTQ